MKVFLALILALLSSGTLASDIESRKEHIEKMEAKTSKEASVRKARSEALLKERNVPINPHLPYIEDASEALIREKEEVALRAMTLLIVAAKAEGLEQEIVDNLINSYDLSTVLSPNERRFIEDQNPSQFDKTQFIWRYEAAWVLLWALSYVEELAPPTSICDVPAAVTFLQERTRERFIADAELRPISDLLDANDLIYRYHWAVVDARVNGLEIPSEIDSSVVLERHYALNWLVGYMDQEWDDVSTDT
ncbi:DUF4272 domain-containing protein [Marinobacter sp. GN3S48]|uniref:DUF4272 domain-containing protein n=1 Tax=Marinobacter sp. GN3S48 TaxID=3382302 RepID=UPI00387A9A8A